MSNRSRQRKSLRIRATSFQSWFNPNLKAHARDIARQGADCGFPSITYTSDTVCIFDRFADEIWAMAVADAEEFGHTNVCEMIAWLQALGHARQITTASRTSWSGTPAKKLAGERE